jgi:hypothetical protein
MAVVPNIFASWVRPRVVMRRLLAAGPREDRALATLIAAAVVMFVAQWPMHARAAHLDPSIPLDGRLAGAAMGVIFIMPLLAYAIAALSHLAARAFGGRGAGWRARMALFWSLLAVSPAVLLQGLVSGLIGPGPALTLTSAVLTAAFAMIWGASLRVAEFEDA